MNRQRQDYGPPFGYGHLCKREKTASSPFSLASFSYPYGSAFRYFDELS